MTSRTTRSRTTQYLAVPTATTSLIAFYRALFLFASLAYKKRQTRETEKKHQHQKAPTKRKVLPLSTAAVLISPREPKLADIKTLINARTKINTDYERRSYDTYSVAPDLYCWSHVTKIVEKCYSCPASSRHSFPTSDDGRHIATSPVIPRDILPWHFQRLKTPHEHYCGHA